MSQNEYDAAARSISLPDKGDGVESALRQSLFAAANTTPDQHAKTLSLAADSGIPPDIAARNFDQITKRNTVQNFPYQQVIQQSPALARWLTDPNNSKLAHDDVEHLSTLEQILNAGRSLAAGVPEAIGGITAGFGDIIDIGAHALGEERGDQGSISIALQEAGQAFKDIGTLWIAPSPEQQNILTQSAGALGQLGAQIAQSIWAPETVLPSLMAMGADTIHGQAKAVGKEGTAASDAAEVAGAVVMGVVGKYGLDKLLDRVPPQIQNAILRRLTDVALSTGYQGVVQVAQGVANNLITKTAIDPNHPIAEGLASDFAIGAISGGVARAGLHHLLPALGASLQRPEASGPEKPEQQQFFEDLGKAVADSKTFQRLPPKVQELIASITKGGPIETFHQDVDQWNEFWQKQGADPREEAQKVGVTPEAYDQAVATDGQLAIRVDEAATKLLAPEETRAFFVRELRRDPEQQNAREEEQSRMAMRELASTETQIAAMPEEQKQSLEASADRVRQDVIGQLTGGRGFDAPAVEAYAESVTRVFRSLGARTGRDPYSIYEPYQLRINRPSSDLLRVLPKTDAMDLVLNKLRKEGVPQPGKETYGPSLVDFLRAKGGVMDQGGELKSLEVDAERRRGERNLVQAKGMPLDTARELAAEAGYLPERSSVAEFLDVIEREVRGKPVYAPQQADMARMEQVSMYEQLDGYLKSLDVDIAKMSNEEIKKLLNDAAAAEIDPRSGDLFEQSAPPSPERFAEYRKQVRQSGGDPAAKLLDSVLAAKSEAQRGQRWRLLLEATPDLNHEPLRQQLASERSQYLQGEDNPRGRFQITPGRTFNIELLQKANLSTFLHETGHMYLEVFGDVVEELRTRPGELTDSERRVVDDYNKALEFLGVSARDQIGREQHEKWARAYEAYLREGKTPSPELRSVFIAFSGWLRRVYRSLQDLRVELTPEVTGVFDRLMATDREIAQAEQDAGVASMLSNAAVRQKLGMTDAEFEAYKPTLDQGRERARETVQAQLLHDVFRENEEWWDRERVKVREQVASEVQRQPVYRALEFLQRGKLPDGSAVPPDSAVKLDRQALIDRYGEAFIKELPKPYVYTRNGGVDPDLIAREFGFSSGDEMIRAIIDAKAKPMKPLIEALTDERMRETHGDKLLGGELPEIARNAVLGESSKIIEFELQAIRKKQREVAPFTKAADLKGRDALAEQRANAAYERRWLEAESNLKLAIAEGRKQSEIDELQKKLDTIEGAQREGQQLLKTLPTLQQVRHWAEDEITKMRAGDVRPETYRVSARRAGRAALEAATSGDFQGAFDHKLQEMMSVELHHAALEAQSDVEGIRKYAVSFDKVSTRQRIGKAGGDYLDQIDKLLERFEFKQRTNKELDQRATLLDFMKSQEAQGHELAVPLDLQNEARQQNYRDMTIGDLRGLRDAVKSIEHWANFQNKLLRADAKADLDALAADGVVSIDAYSPGTRKRILEPRLPGAQPTRNLQSFELGHLPLGTLTREIDGWRDGGWMHENVMRPFDESGTAEAVRFERATAAVSEIYNTAFGGKESSLYQTQFIPEIGGSLSKMARLMTALNFGNDGNRSRLLASGIGGTGPLDEFQIAAILNTLDEKDWTFVRSIWNHIDSYWPEISALYKKTTGVAPQKVEPSPFVTRFGREEGGYFPIKYENQLSARAGSNAEASFADLIGKSSYLRAMTSDGHTVARLENVTEPLRADFGVITEHLQQVIHDLTHRETLIDAGRLLGRRDVQDALMRNYGDQMFKEIKGDIRDIAIGRTPPGDWYRLYSAIRGKAVQARLGWSAVTALMHVTNLTSGMFRVDPVSVGKGLVKWFGSARDAEFSAQWVAGTSDQMRLRWKTRMVELDEIRDQIGLSRGKWSAAVHDFAAKVGVTHEVTAAVADSYLYAVHRIIQFAEIPTWIAAYEKAGAAGRAPDDARSIADRAILDAFGGGQIKDLARVQKEPLGKVFSTFMTYQLSAHRQFRELIKKKAPAGRKIVDATLLAAVPIASAMLVHQISRKKDKESFARKLAGETFDHAVGMFVFARELSGFVQSGEYSGPAAVGVLGTLKRLSHQVSEGEITAGALRSANEAAGEILGYPAPQINRTVEGILALWEGKTTNPAAVLFGP